VTAYREASIVARRLKYRALKAVPSAAFCLFSAMRLYQPVSDLPPTLIFFLVEPSSVVPLARKLAE
jgi:hypothetical protein